MFGPVVRGMGSWVGVYSGLLSTKFLSRTDFIFTLPSSPVPLSPREVSRGSSLSLVTSRRKSMELSLGYIRRSGVLRPLYTLDRKERKILSQRRVDD